MTDTLTTPKPSQECEYITLEEASRLTDLKKTYLRDLSKRAGMTRIGRNALLKKEFDAYWAYRTKVNDGPKRPNEDRKMRMERINREWRSLL